MSMADMSSGKVHLGTKYYKVQYKTNVFRSKEQKIIDGEIWVKYQKPIREYSIEEYEVIGVVEKTYRALATHESKISMYLENYDYITADDLIMCCDGNYILESTEDLEEYFKTKEEAEESITKSILADTPMNTPSGNSLGKSL